MSKANIHHEVLPNGLTLLLREAHLAPVANLQIWAQVGSADERPGEEGLAHFHEHMLFKGTERRGVGEVAGEVEGAGGQINAYTSFDMTVYYTTLPSEAIYTGLDVLSDALRHSVFDPGEVKRETEVVLEEIRRSEDSPAHVLSDAVFREAYRQHPYGAPILGPPENVASFDRERVMRFFQRWYTPDNLVVAAAGDFEPRALAEAIGRAFGNAEPGGVQRSRTPEPAQTALRSSILRRPFEGVRLDLSWPSVSFRDPDATYLELLSFILGECESSRLVREIKERRGLANRIDASSYTPLDPGLFSINVEVEGNDPRQAIAAIMAEVERLRQEPVTRDELERARVNFLATEQFERESVSGLANKLGIFHVLGDSWESEEAYFAAIRSATPDDLLRVAQKYLASESLTAAALLPEAADSALDEAAIADAVTSGVERTRRRFATPKPADAETADRTAKTQTESPIYSYALEGGAMLHVCPRREIPVVAVRAAFTGGLLTETPSSAGISAFLTSMWLRGTRSRSAADFARSSENIAAEIDGFSGRNSLGLTLDVTREEFEPALDLFAEVLLEPAFDEGELERERRETLAYIDRRENRLAQLAFILLGETLYPTHPYRLPLLGSRESVSAIDAAGLRAHHDRLIRRDNLVIGVAGDLDPEEAAKALSTRLAQLPAGEGQLPLPHHDPAPSGIREVELNKDRAQAHLVMGFAGLTVHDPDRYALEVVSQLLAGQGGRLFLDLRDRRSLAYSVSAANVEGVAPGFFSVYIATAPDKQDEARSGMLEHLERLVSEKPADDELERAIRYLAGANVISGQRSSSHAAHLALDALYGLGPAAHQAYSERIRAVSADDVLRVAQRVIRLDAYTLASVRPG